MSSTILATFFLAADVRFAVRSAHCWNALFSACARGMTKRKHVRRARAHYAARLALIPPRTTADSREYATAGWPTRSQKTQPHIQGGTTSKGSARLAQASAGERARAYELLHEELFRDPIRHLRDVLCHATFVGEQGVLSAGGQACGEASSCAQCHSLSLGSQVITRGKDSGRFEYPNHSVRIL